MGGTPMSIERANQTGACMVYAFPFSFLTCFHRSLQKQWKCDELGLLPKRNSSFITDSLRSVFLNVLKGHMEALGLGL